MDFRPERALLAVWRIIVWIFFAVFAFLTTGILVIVGIVSGEIVPVMVGLLIGLLDAVVAILLHGYFGLFHATIAYGVQEKAVTLRYGVWWRMDKVIPMEKITDVRIVQGPLERMYGFSQIHIFTPSTGAMIPEGRMLGVPEAAKVRGMILANINALREKSRLKDV